MSLVSAPSREQRLLAALDRGVDGAPWQRAPELDTDALIAFRSSPCNPFDCDSPAHQGRRPIPCRHVERFPR